MKKCKGCNGSGQVFNGFRDPVRACGTCSGTGRVAKPKDYHHQWIFVKRSDWGIVTYRCARCGRTKLDIEK